MGLRGPGAQADVTPAALTPAPMPADPGLAQAYDAPVAPPVQQAAAPLPLQFDPTLENTVQAQGGNNELEPIVQRLMRRLGMLSLIRNQANEKMIDPYSQG